MNESIDRRTVLVRTGTAVTASIALAGCGMPGGEEEGEGGGGEEGGEGGEGGEGEEGGD